MELKAVCPEQPSISLMGVGKEPGWELQREVKSCEWTIPVQTYVLNFSQIFSLFPHPQNAFLQPETKLFDQWGSSRLQLETL